VVVVVQQQHHCQKLPSHTVLQLLKYTWSSVLKTPCCTLVYLTVQLLFESQESGKESQFILVFNGNEVQQTGTDERVNMNR